MKAPFRYLLYREAVMSFKHMKSALITFVVMVIMFMLTRLSLECGNLARGFTDETKAAMAPVLAVLDLFPVVVLATTLSCISEANMNENSSAWRKFRLSLPVSPWKYTLAKFTFIAIFLIASIILGTGYMALMGRIGGTGFTLNNFATILLLFAFFLTFAMMMGVLVLLLGTVERAGITIAIISFLFFRKIIIEDGLNADGLAEIFNNSGKNLHWIILAIIGIMAVGYVLTALLLKRRER